MSIAKPGEVDSSGAAVVPKPAASDRIGRTTDHDVVDR
jgi:hypothetical protein